VFLCFFLEATRASDYESFPGSSSRAAVATKHIDHASRAAVRDPTVDSLLAFDSELFSGRVEGCHCYSLVWPPSLGRRWLEDRESLRRLVVKSMVVCTPRPAEVDRGGRGTEEPFARLEQLERRSSNGAADFVEGAVHATEGWGNGRGPEMKDDWPWAQSDSCGQTGVCGHEPLNVDLGSKEVSRCGCAFSS
jgi:hypothetical protein